MTEQDGTKAPRSLPFLVACVALSWLLSLTAHVADVIAAAVERSRGVSHGAWHGRSAVGRRLTRYADAVYDHLGIPRSTLRLPRSLRNGVTRARRLVQPFLHIETELEPESDTNEDGVLTPTSLRVLSNAQHKRASLNATIRDCLRRVPAHELQSVFRVQTCTWNVNQTAPPPYGGPFLAWLLGTELASRVLGLHEDDHDGAVSAELQDVLDAFPDLIVVTLQEVDMGGVALVRESTNSSILWAETITHALQLAARGRLQYRKLKMIQLVGLVLLVLVQDKHVNYIAHVRLSLTRTGAMRMLGNKGSVAMRATVYGKRFLFVAAHFVAHKHNERRRTRNYHAALRDIRFDLSFGTDDESDVLCTFVDASVALSNASAAFVKGRSAWDRLTTLLSLTRRMSHEVERRALDQHDYVFFLGDLNSRLHSVSGTEIRRRVQEQSFDYLLCRDELRQGMVSGAIFDGFQEAGIDFAPTYKFDPGTNRYDTSRKWRDPAWCDRVLFRVLQPSSTTTTLLDMTMKSAEGAFARSPTSAAASLTEEGAGRTRSDGDHTSSSCDTASTRPRRTPWVQLCSISSLDAAETASEGPTRPTTELTSSDGSSEDDSHGDGATLRRVQRRPRRAHTDTTVDVQRGDAASITSTCASSAAIDPPCAHDTPVCSTSSPLLRRGLSEATFHAVRQPWTRGAAPAHAVSRFPTLDNVAAVMAYYSVPSLCQSDHLPVAAQFEVAVIRLGAKVIAEVQGCLRARLQTDEDSGADRLLASSRESSSMH